MRLLANIAVSLALLLGAASAWAEEVAWRLVQPVSPAVVPAASQSVAPPMLGEPDVLLGDAVPCRAEQELPAASLNGSTQSSLPVEQASSGSGDATVSLFPIHDNFGILPGGVVVRCQGPDPVPPPVAPPFGGISGPPPAAFGPPANPNDCGIGEKSGGGFWNRFSDGTKSCCKEIFGPLGQMFQGGSEHKPFQSDHAFDMFTSPVSNPFFFLDPRSLTEVKPIFIFQQTRTGNPMFAGGTNEYVGLQGSLALTDRISLRITELGLSFMEPNNPSNNSAFQPNVGPSELHVGPQITIIRNVATKTLLSAGMTFEIPWGSEKEFQHTGDLGVVPYVSFGQNFLYKEGWGSFNFLNTTGWAGGVQRSDFFFSSFHLDYNILNLNRFYPLVEVNWAVYTNSGNQTPVNFEGWDLYNFGATNVAGTNMCSLNIGGRWQINDFWAVGLTGGCSLIGGGGQLDGFRLTFDMIFRY